MDFIKLGNSNTESQKVSETSSQIFEIGLQHGWVGQLGQPVLNGLDKSLTAPVKAFENLIN